MVFRPSAQSEEAKAASSAIESKIDSQLESGGRYAGSFRQERESRPAFTMVSWQTLRAAYENAGYDVTVKPLMGADELMIIQMSARVKRKS